MWALTAMAAGAVAVAAAAAAAGVTGGGEGGPAAAVVAPARLPLSPPPVSLPMPLGRQAFRYGPHSGKRVNWSRDKSVHLGMSLAPFCDTKLTHSELMLSILSMRVAGVRHVSINVFGLQAHEWATVITTGDSADCKVTKPMVRWLVQRVHAAGMKVFLKPHVDLINGHWRGEIRPSAAWFASYRAFIWEWAAMAQQERVATFSIGVEKKRTLGHVDEWLRILRGVKGIFGGQVTYCANWDSYSAVSPKLWKE